MIKKLHLKKKFKHCLSFSIYPCGKHLMVETTQVNIMQLEMVANSTNTLQLVISFKHQIPTKSPFSTF